MIETERLLLRAFTENDAADLYEYLEVPAVNCFMDMRLENPYKAREAAIKRSEDTEYYFAIELKEEGKVIGEIFAHPDDEEGDTFSPCLMLNAKYHGKGYASEAIAAFFDYLFYEKNARRIYAYTEDYNTSCQKMCEKLGMRKEGFFKEFISFVNNPDGTPKYENTIQYAILKREWEQKR